MTETQRSPIDIASILALILDIIVVHVKFICAILEAIVRLIIPQQPISVKGQNILITGTGHGIGKDLALQYAALGAKIICWDINEKNNLQSVKEIQAAGGQAAAYVCNVTKREEIMNLAKQVKKEHGFIHVIVNNAGIMPCHPLLQHTEEEIRTMYDINVLAHFWMLQAFLPDMIERNEGHIIALSSCAGMFGLPNLVPYCGTKFAVRGLMYALKEELRSKNPESKIKFTTILPYMVDTGLCKRPHFRFASIMKLVKAQDAASSIISAHRHGLEEASIPRVYLHLNKILQLLPSKAVRIANDFLDAGVHSDM